MRHRTYEQRRRLPLRQAGCSLGTYASVFGSSDREFQDSFRMLGHSHINTTQRYLNITGHPDISEMIENYGDANQTFH